tara:strand:+ start:637 stop:1092 length:456 start_codon:yes stop_codon:yes gene_type:complete
VSDTVFALLILIKDDYLLLPNAAAAEVAGLENFEARARDAQKWIAGWYSSAERRIPVLSFEALAGGRCAEPGKRGRIVIINPLGQRMASGGFAILAQDQPHLVSLTKASVSPSKLRDADSDELVLSRVRVNDKDAIIPDLEHIEAQLSGLA